MPPLPEAKQQLLHLVVGRGLSVAPVRVLGLHTLQAQLQAPVRAVLGATPLCQAGLTWFDKMETELRIVISKKKKKTEGIKCVLGKFTREIEEKSERKRNDCRY